jgi:hypothetical protein
MRIHRGLVASIFGVLLAASGVGAQPALEVTTAPARPETSVLRPEFVTVPPSGADAAVTGPYVPYEPYFIGPTAKTRTGEYGFSAWLAPNTPADRSGIHGVSGWAALGFTFTWGGPPYRLPTSHAR